MSSFNFEVRAGQDLLVEQKSVEIVERKGKGHPDSLCDGAAEKLSVALSHLYRQEAGRILHHNVDKAVLVGGSSQCSFGRGEVIKPINLFIVGRATEELNEKKLFHPEKLENEIKEWLMNQVRYFRPEHFEVKLMMRCGSVDLRKIFIDEDKPPLANDTSLAVAHAPLSELERLVLETEKYLNSPAGKEKFPALGEDIKIMGVRHGKTINLTLAAAFVACQVPSREKYEEIKSEVVNFLQKEFVPQYTARPVVIKINNADTEDSAYLTVTGTSAEAGDDGQVGRGNRACGLITPCRPMSLEAIAGKNPVSHVGKIYSIMSQLMANRIVEQMPEVKQVYVYMVSRINEPITEPQAVNIELWGVEAAKAKPEIKAIVEEVLGNWREIRDGFLEGRWPIY